MNIPDHLPEEIPTVADQFSDELDELIQKFMGSGVTHGDIVARLEFRKFLTLQQAFGGDDDA